ncbi:MAG: PTS sugar transporter subunit IIC [Erysipelotrichaceae bacterium]|nr:PTS sugar transporter subunit IIC [Erysipelotrichaceae bacterium]
MKAFTMRTLRFISTHHYVKALQKSMVSVIGISFVAGILMILQNPPVSSLTNFEFITVHWVNFAIENADLLNLAIQLTLGLIGVYTLVAFIITLSHHYQLNPFHPIVSGLIAYLFLSVGFIPTMTGLRLDLTYLGYSGVFVAFILGIFVVEFNRLSIKILEKIKSRSKAPQRLSLPIESTLSSLVIIVGALIIRFFLQQNNVLLPDIIFNALTPFLRSSNTLVFVLTVILLSKLLWFIGINGNSLILLSLTPMMVMFSAKNLFAYQNDQALPYIFASGFIFFEFGVLPCVMAILLFSKNKAHMSSAKLGLLPAIFNFQETLVAGLPLTFNGLFLVPFILSSVISLGGAYLAMMNYWVNKPLFVFSETLPSLLGAFLSTVDWRAIVLWIGLFILSTLVYYPFIRYANKKVAKVVLPSE